MQIEAGPEPWPHGTRFSAGRLYHPDRMRPHASSILDGSISPFAMASWIFSSVKNLALGISMSRPAEMAGEVECVAPQSLTTKPEKLYDPLSMAPKVCGFSHAYLPLIRL